MRLISLGPLLVLAGCWEVSPAFVCQRDEQCAVAGEPGVCEPGPTRYCSHADGLCPSGRRYRERAGDGLGGQCVGAGDLGAVDLSALDLWATPDLSAASDMSVPADMSVPSDLTVADMSVAGDMTLATDMSAADLASADMSPTCPQPHLLVAAEDLSGAGAIGQILRFSLAGGGAPVACPTLTGGGALGPLIQTVGWISPTRVAAASRVGPGYQLLDSSTDVIVSSNPNLSEVYPVDIFPIRGAANQELIAVGSGPGGGPYITYVDFFDGSTKADTKSYSMLTLSTVYGMTRSLLDPKHLFATNVSLTSSAIMDVDPWTPAKSEHLADTTTDLLRTISSMDIAGLKRTVWTATNASTSRIYYSEHSAGSPSIVGPISCATPPAACTYLHSVPDPTMAGRVIALCEDDASPNVNARYVLRFGGGPCTLLLDGRTLAADRRLTRLSVSPP